MGSTTGISPSELGIQILQNCRNELYDIFPQLDGAFASLDYVPDILAEAVGTNGDVIRFSPIYLIRQYRETPAAVRRGYLHMLLHCLFLHLFSDTASSRLWGIACDMAVEQIIEQADIPRLAIPVCPVREACFQIMGGETLSAERLCGMVGRGEFPFSPAELETAFHYDNHALWNKSADDAIEGRRKWTAVAAGASRGGYRPGTMAGEQKETIQASHHGMYDYRRFLRRFTTLREELMLDPESFDQVFYSYGLEYYGNFPLIEPLEYREAVRLAELVIAIDTSGSCSTETVRRFLEETWEIISRRENFFHKMKVYLIQCDCVIQNVTVIRSAEDWQRSCEHITIHGRGGTDFTPVFRYVEELRKKRELKDLKALLYFTDGDGVYPRERTDYETAFVFLHKTDKMEQVPPWAAKLVVGEPARRGGRL